MILKILKNPHFYLGLFLAVIILLFLWPSGYKFSPKSAVFNFEHPPQPVVLKAPRPQLSTNTYILVDVATNKILIAANEHQRIYPASTTKLATALTALNTYPLDEIVTVTQSYQEGKIMNLHPGDKVTVKTLISGLLIHSANDAAFTLASHYSQGYQAFVNYMNELTKKYGLKNTHFTNPDGIHDHSHYSTVYDLAQLGRLAAQNDTIRQIVKTTKITLTDTTRSVSYPITTTNELLGVIPEVEGFKTGWTPEGGSSFIGLLNLDGHYLISVIAQSQDRFADTKLLLDWAKNNLTWRNYR